MENLQNKKCVPCEGGVKPLSQEAIHTLLSQLHGWELDAKKDCISKTFHFKNFFRTMGFVNVVAWIANEENHHPDLEISYGSCKIYYSTHAVHGLSENDFICAAKIEAIVK